MSSFYQIDSARVTHTEYWWGAPGPLVLVGWISKWLKIRLPSSSDDPNTESTFPFVVDALPEDIVVKFEPLTRQLYALGFTDPIYHVIHDPGTRTTIYWATFRHTSGHHFARIHHRRWHQAQRADRGTDALFMTALTDGSFIVTTGVKRDLRPPPSVITHWLTHANPDRLWEAHQLHLSKVAEGRFIEEISSREELLQAIERLHVLYRDFHLERGVFRPRTQREEETALAYASSVAQAQADGLENAEVLAEIDRLQNQKANLGTGIWVLVISTVAFLLLGIVAWDWKFTLWLIPILLIHESGHWLAMRLFHYRNLRMFFIPFFGAAVTGHHWNVAGWKKSIVFLAGPLPGIVIGMGLGIAGLATNTAWMRDLAFLFILINGFNLLPILPLDGGRVLQATLFCRNRWLDSLFRILAIMSLIGMGLIGAGKVLPYLAIPLLLGLPLSFKMARIADHLRRRPQFLATDGNDNIPPATAQAIVSEVKTVLPKSLNNKTVAQHALNVLETINARPPGILGTFLILAFHGGAFVLAVVVAFLLVLSKHGGGLGEFLKAAISQPQQAVECTELHSWRGPNAQPSWVAPQNVLVSSYPNHRDALRAFSQLTNQIPPDSSLLLFGQSTLLSVPGSDDAAREHWFDVLQQGTTNVFVLLTNQPLSLSLFFVAPTAAVATNLVHDLSDYLKVVGAAQIQAPWTPAAQQPSFQKYRTARRSWAQLEEELGSVYKDPAIRDFSKRMVAAGRRGATVEAQRLNDELAAKVEELREQKRNQLRASSEPTDAKLLKLNKAWNELNYTNRQDRLRLAAELAEVLGPVPRLDEKADPAEAALGAGYGIVDSHGLLVEVTWITLTDPMSSLPVLLPWLCQQQCQSFKYDLFGGGSYAGLEEEEE